MVSRPLDFLKFIFESWYWDWRIWSHIGLGEIWKQLDDQIERTWPWRYITYVRHAPTLDLKSNRWIQRVKWKDNSSKLWSQSNDRIYRNAWSIVVGQTRSNWIDGPEATRLFEIHIRILIIGIEEYDDILVLVKFENNWIIRLREYSHKDT